jgi:hypothetical protein
MTPHSVFVAALSLIFAASSHFREPKRYPFRPGHIRALRTVDIVRSTRTFSNVLVAVSEQWTSLRSCHEVFDRLSDALVSDSVNHADTLYSGFGQNGSSTLAIDAELRACFDDMQRFYNYGNFDGPLVQLSKDWLGDIEEGDSDLDADGEMSL